MVPKEALLELERAVGERWVLKDPIQLISYESDALSLTRSTPDVVVLPKDEDEVIEVVKICRKYGIPITPRGSGTALSGSAIAVKGGVLLVFSRMNRFIELDEENGVAVVEPGVLTKEVSDIAKMRGLNMYFAPDPASYEVSTIAGNIAHNAGGPHCLKHGVVSNYLLGARVVLPDGEVYEVGGKALERPGYDLTGLLLSSEGTLAIITSATLKLSKVPEGTRTIMAIFDRMDDAAQAVSDIIASGIIPSALEFMDHLTIKAVEEKLKVGYPLDAEAILLIEVDGLKDGLDVLADRIVEICKRNGVREIKRARSEEERELLWRGRRGIAGAVGYYAPYYLLEDGVVPRTKLVEAMKRAREIGEKYGFIVPNGCHLGDGNLHPYIMFKDLDEETKRRVMKAGDEILKVCVELGGSVSGEHGIGISKKELLPVIYSKDDIEVMKRVKGALDPDGLFNPGKIFPD